MPLLHWMAHRALGVMDGRGVPGLSRPRTLDNNENRMMMMLMVMINKTNDEVGTWGDTGIWAMQASRPSPRREGGLGSLVPCHGYDNSQDSEDGFSYAVRQTAYGPPPSPPTPALRASGALVPLCTAALSQPGR